MIIYDNPIIDMVNFIHWIGLRENLQETMVFTITYRAFRLKFSHHPILWFMGDNLW